MLVHLEFNIFKETKRINIYEKYFDKAVALGVTFKEFYKALNMFFKHRYDLVFDENYLKPADFIDFCCLINITPYKLYDDYYKFVLGTNYSRIIFENRSSLNLTQKELAKISSLSPVTIGYFENKLSYPTRKQYRQLKEVLKI